MNPSLLNRKSILIVDEDSNTLAVMEENIEDAVTGCRLETSTTYQRARDLLSAWSYDIAIIGMTGFEGCKLLKQAVFSRVPIVIFSANGQNAEALSTCMEIGVKAYLSKNRVNDIVPFLEDVLQHESMPAWKRMAEKTRRLLGTLPDQRPTDRRIPLPKNGTFYIGRPAQKPILITF